MDSRYKTVKKQVNQSVKNLATSYRAELIRKQLDALETLWGIFDATSRTGGQSRIIQHREGNVYLSVLNTNKFITFIKKSFNARVGCVFQKHAEGNYLISETICSLLQMQHPLICRSLI